MCLSEGAYPCHDANMGVTEELAELSSLLPPCEFQQSNRTLIIRLGGQNFYLQSYLASHVCTHERFAVRGGAHL